MAEPRVLKLQSPAYGEAIFYKWPLSITKKHDEGQEIVDTIKLVCEDFPELKYAVDNVMLRDYDPKDYDQMTQLCQRYNKAIRNILSLWKGRAPPPRMYQPPSKDLLRHIINLCYSHAIKEPEKLNIYEPFSPEVYGETSFDMVAQILEDVQHPKDESFVDLGSGVGQVVLQAAASNQFKECFGVEKAETPAMYSKALENEFRKWMDWFGKIYSDFTIEKGDFLEDKWKSIINDCGVVFVNNFAFGPVVNHQLKMRFQTMKEGSKIISSREFSPTNFKFNKRNLGELGAMMKVTEMKPRSEEASVSWTDNKVSYYLHTVDRTRLEKYFSILKKKKEKGTSQDVDVKNQDGQELDEDEMSLYSESNCSADVSGQAKDAVESLEDNLDDLYLGTTTRHQWQLLTDTIKQSKQDADTPDQQVGKKKDGRGRKKKIKKHGLKDKILRKYGQQAIKKAREAQEEEEERIIEDDVISSASDESPSEEEIEDSDYFHESADEKPPIKANLIKERKKPHKRSSKVVEKNQINSRQKPRRDSEKTDTTDHVKPTKKNRSGKNGKKKNKVSGLEKDLDMFLAGMKDRYMEFIGRMNTKEYADRLKVMIECETAKKKLLERQISEVDRSVQSLISDGLKNFSTRLNQLGVTVRTPLELLSQSTILAEKRKQLENKVLNMEIQVYNVEEKHRRLCAARDEKNREYGIEPLLESEEDTIGVSKLTFSRKKGTSQDVDVKNQEDESGEPKITTKLCTAILNALNHRRSLIDKESSLSEQISILEKVSPNGKETISNKEDDETTSTKIQTSESNRSKPRPVAFVPPRMLSEDKQTTLSPDMPSGISTTTTLSSVTSPNNEPIRRGRGRPKKRQAPNDECSTERDSSQESKCSDERPANLSETVTNLQREAIASNHFFACNVQEERAPIVFPPKISKTKRKKDANKEFLKSSSKLLGSTSSKLQPDLWSPLSSDKCSTKTPHQSVSKIEPGSPIYTSVSTSVNRTFSVDSEFLSRELEQRTAQLKTSGAKSHQPNIINTAAYTNLLRDQPNSSQTRPALLYSNLSSGYRPSPGDFLPHSMHHQTGIQTEQKEVHRTLVATQQHIFPPEMFQQQPRHHTTLLEHRLSNGQLPPTSEVSKLPKTSRSQLELLQQQSKKNECAKKDQNKKEKSPRKVRKKKSSEQQPQAQQPHTNLTTYHYPMSSSKEHFHNLVPPTVEDHFKTSLEKFQLDAASNAQPFLYQLLHQKTHHKEQSKATSVISSTHKVQQKKDEIVLFCNETDTLLADNDAKTHSHHQPIKTHSTDYSSFSRLDREKSLSRESVLKNIPNSHFQQSTSKSSSVSSNISHLSSIASRIMTVTSQLSSAPSAMEHCLAVKTPIKTTSQPMEFYPSLFNRGTSSHYIPPSIPGGHPTYLHTPGLTSKDILEGSSVPSILSKGSNVTSSSTNLPQQPVYMPLSQPVTDRNATELQPPAKKPRRQSKKAKPVISSHIPIKPCNQPPSVAFYPGGSMKAQAVFQPPIVLTNPSSFSSKNSLKPQVINILPSTSNDNSKSKTNTARSSPYHPPTVIQPSRIVNLSHAAHVPQMTPGVMNLVNPPKVVLLPVTGIHQSIKQSDPKKLSVSTVFTEPRQQTMTSPTFPPPIPPTTTSDKNGNE